MNQQPNTGSYNSPAAAAGSSGMALAALILGIIGVCVAPLGLVAIILGIMVLSSNKPEDRNSRGFATTGVVLGGVGLVIVPIIAMLIAILLPALGAARNTAQRMQNSTQLRGIHQGMVTFANSNKNNFPGLYSNGGIIVDGAETGFSGDGNTPMARNWIMLDGGFITPDYLISPSETGAIYVKTGGGAAIKENSSYAMLGFDTQGQPKQGANGQPPYYDVDPASIPRYAEWSQTLSNQSIVLSDRNTGTDTSTGIESIHSNSPGTWQGSVLWNDNHVGFENTHIFQTRFANGGLNMQDHLFEDEPTTPQGANALMVHE